MINVEQIEFLLSADMKILKIHEGDTEGVNSVFSWWIANQFTPAKVTGEEGTSFHTVQGIEITDFVNTNHVIQGRDKFIAALETYIAKRSFLTCNFHFSIKFKFYVNFRRQA